MAFAGADVRPWDALHQVAIAHLRPSTGPIRQRRPAGLQLDGAAPVSRLQD